MGGNDDTRVWLIQLRKGLAELCLLASLGPGEAYGYDLLRRIRGYPGLSITEGTLYPMLNRAAEAGWVAMENRPSDSGPPRRYYRLTRTGRKRLAVMADAWREIGVSVERLLEEAEGSA